jgi:ubiquilin
MADSGSEDESSRPQVTITLKTTAANHQISVADNSTIGKVKKVLSQKINQPVEKICLIFSGKILKDHETLQTYNIKDGMAIHMVIRAGTSAPSSGSNLAASRPAAASTSPSTTGSSTSTTTSATPAAATIPGMPPGMNMDTARRLMDSPFMQQMMNNPEILRNMIGGNEHIQSLIRQNPEIGHLLNDPEILRQTMEMIRNPNMFNEMMRNHDQAIRNLQGIPGGEAALQRLYQDIQEPLLNSATSGSNPFASANDANAESRSQRAGVENAEALPNPWGGSGARTGAGNDSNASTIGSTGAGLGGMSGMPNIASMMNNPELQETMRAMMSNPEMQQTMRSMMSNPEILRTMMSPEMLQQAQGLLGGNVNLPTNNDEFARMTEQLSGLMSNPETVSELMNPRVMEAMNNIRTNINIIQTEAPGLFQQMFRGVLSSMNNMQGSGTTSATSPSTTTTATDAASGTGQANPLMNPQLMNMLSSLSGNPAAFGGGANIAPEERYRSQLDQLVSMGFSNREANIRALQDTNGDVNAAIDRLLNN